MSTTISIPTPLRPFADRQQTVVVEGRTVGELLDALATRYPDLRRHLYADDGRLRSFVNVFLNDRDVRSLDREATIVEEGDTLSIIPSVAGGIGATAAAPGP